MRVKRKLSGKAIMECGKKGGRIIRGGITAGLKYSYRCGKNTTSPYISMPKKKRKK